MNQLKAELIDRLRDAGLTTFNDKHREARGDYRIVTLFGKTRPERNAKAEEVVSKLSLGSYLDKTYDPYQIKFRQSAFEPYTIIFKPTLNKDDIKTDEQESLAAYYAAAKFADPNTKYTFDQRLATVQTKYDISSLLEKASDSWKKSSTMIAEELYKQYGGSSGKQFIFCQRSQSKFVDNINKNATFLKNKANKQSMVLDKWNPADMWMVKPQFINFDFKQFKDIKELNKFLYDSFITRSIIGVSLKKAVFPPKATVFNFDRKINEKIKFNSFFYGINFFENIRGDIKYNGNNVVSFRQFSSNQDIVGEIAGIGARGGKVGFGPLLEITKAKITDKRKIANRFIKEKDELINEIYERGSKLDPRSINKYKDVSNLETYLNNKSVNYFISKLQVLDLFEHFSKLNPKTIEQQIQDLISYAASETEISSVFVKVSN